ncbi:MAG: hypothetical protein RML35_05455 [Chloroherpetonaceae bacterium]|nr:Rpn family recombination-promoting nuclease/putative transposase [Chloroherpetonaceae bacterium]MDW8465638.1 hypothetical protein [Chloroherpetonaceae bacterium]
MRNSFRKFSSIFASIMQRQAVMMYPLCRAEVRPTGVYAELAKRYLRRIYLDEIVELAKSS